MTNKEAISIITQIKGIITNDNSWSDVAKVAVKEAFDLAIMALNHEVYWEDVKQALNGWLNNTTSPNTALNDIYRAYMGKGEQKND